MERHHAEGGEHQPWADETASEPPSAAATDPAAERATEPIEPPRIFLADASEGLPEDEALRGIWLDAALDADELEQAVHRLLQDSPATGAKAYRIAAASGFQGFEVSVHESLGTIARVARGIAAHGRAFVAYVDAWGSSEDAVTEFERYFVGTWPSVAAWAEATADDFGWLQQLDETVPAEIRPYVHLDYTKLGRELTYDAYVVEDDDRGEIHVFRLHA